MGGIKMKDKYEKAFAELIEIIEEYHAESVIDLAKAKTDGVICFHALDEAYKNHVKLNEILETADRLRKARERMTVGDQKKISDSYNNKH